MEKIEQKYIQFEVIADYPLNNHFKVGEIITLNEVDEREHIPKANYVRKPIMYSFRGGNSISFYEEDLQKYPHIFKQIYSEAEYKVEITEDSSLLSKEANEYFWYKNHIGKSFNVKRMDYDRKRKLCGFGHYEIDECWVVTDGEHIGYGILKKHCK